MSLWKVLHKLESENKSSVVVTIIEVRGSAPREVGAKLVATHEGLCYGTIGGGKVELAALNIAKDILTNTTVQAPRVVTWNLQRDIGMTCGGEVTLLFEHFCPTHWPIVIFGAGHIGQALSRILRKLPCNLHCIDSRIEWLDRLGKVSKTQHPHPENLVKNCHPSSFFLCMTMGHSFDMPILKEIAKHFPDAPYVGVIGSEIKAKKIRRELAEAKIDKSFIDKLHVPMGLSIGGNHPQEIAISIAAQLLMVRDQLSKSNS